MANNQLLRYAEQYILPKCNSHNQQILQRICTDINCPQFFKATCMDCIEVGHDHNIKSLYNIKPVLDGFAQQIYDIDIQTDQNSKQNDEQHYLIHKMMMRFSKQYKALSEEFLQLSVDIAHQATELLNKLSGDLQKVQSKEYLSEILGASANTQKLTTNLKKLKEMAIINKTEHTVTLDITPQKNDQKVDYDATQLDINFHLNSNYNKIQDIISKLRETSLDDLIVYKIPDDQIQISKFGCIKCGQRYKETELQQSEICGHYFCKICLSSFKDFFIKSKKTTHIKCLGNLNKKCEELISRKEWESILGIGKFATIKKDSQEIQ